MREAFSGFFHDKIYCNLIELAGIRHSDISDWHSSRQLHVSQITADRFPVDEIPIIFKIPIYWNF
jgi:hypothetical protein